MASFSARDGRRQSSRSVFSCATPGETTVTRIEPKRSGCGSFPAGRNSNPFSSPNLAFHGRFRLSRMRVELIRLRED